MARITLDDFLKLVNAGGWQISGGFLTKDKNVASGTIITGARLFGEVLEFRESVGTIAGLRSPQLSFITIGETRPREIMVNGPLLSKSRKKGDEDDQIGTHLQLVNREAQAQHEAEMLRRRQAEAASTTSEPIPVAEGTDGRILALLLRHKKQLIGARLTDLIEGPDGITITLDNRFTFNIALDGSGTQETVSRLEESAPKAKPTSWQQPS